MILTCVIFIFQCDEEMADYISESPRLMVHGILCNDQIPLFRQPQEMDTFSQDKKIGSFLIKVR